MPRSTDIEVCAVGDVTVNREAPVSILRLAIDVLRSADVSFGNCESTYASTGQRNPHTRAEVRADPANIDALRAGFDVMSFANNHHLDAGEEAFLQTLDLLHASGIATCGAGRTLSEARRPAIIERRGTRVAFLAYTAILFPGYDATETRPGAVPLRISTHYEQVEMEQPGSPPRIVTLTDPDDLAALVADVGAAHDEADVVVVTPHWGLHFTPGAIADYESEVGRAAIDAGADIILGHHQHILKPIQVYKGKVIFHGMGNFAVDADIRDYEDSQGIRELVERYPGVEVGYRPEYPTYPFHPLARQTLMVSLRIRDGALHKVSFRPCYINPHGQPEPLTTAHNRFTEVASYVREITAKAGFQTDFLDGPGEVEIRTA